MVVWIAISLIILTGILSLLPLRLSLFTSAALLAGAMSYFTIIPIVDYGEFPTDFFIAGLVITALFT